MNNNIALNAIVLLLVESKKAEKILALKRIVCKTINTPTGYRCKKNET